ncbi:ABC transporter ATP-binding protein [Wukongibacter baidiensis]|uniref:ABC transporter ATP-binding protein n=1 Tax=Wukongibacter baidiensis TaxID=1723361 RepID=UPI003D7FE3EB
MKNLLRLSNYIKKYSMYSLLAIISMFVEVVAGLYIPFLMTKIIDEALPSGDLNLLRNTALMMIFMALGTIIAGLINNYCAQYIAQYATANLRLDLFKKIQTLSFVNVDKFKTGRLITSSTNDMLQIKTLFMLMFRSIIRGPLMLIGGLILAIRTSMNLSGIYLIIIPALIIGIGIIMAKALPKFTQVQKELDDVNNIVLESVNAPRVIKSFVNMEYENKRFTEKNENYRKISTSANKIIAFAMPVITIVVNLGIASILFLSASLIEKGILVSNGVADAGIIMAFFNYTMQILMGLLMLAMMLIFVSRAEVSAKRVNEIFDEISDLTNSPWAIKDFKLTGKVEFRNVDFSYSRDGNNVLSDISFKVEPGETIGIIGSTGTGKSTLVQLLPRLYDAKNGEVLLDGHNVKDLDIESLREQVSMASQKPIIFSGSIKSNILQGNENASYEEIREASKRAAALEFIEKLEKQFDSEVHQKGANLSGGQKQRLSLTRAFIRKPAIMILDDVTSAVDAKSEEQIKSNIEKLSKNMTTFIISQKISTIIDADKIIVLNNYGKLDGFGTHDEMLKSSKVYQEIYNSQFGIGGSVNE